MTQTPTELEQLRARAGELGVDASRMNTTQAKAAIAKAEDKAKEAASAPSAAPTPVSPASSPAGRTPRARTRRARSTPRRSPARRWRAPRATPSTGSTASPSTSTSTSTTSTPTPTPTPTAPTYGTPPAPPSDDVSVRAIDAPPVASQRVPSRRGVPDSAPRAETTGYYHDREGKRRVLGAGQIVPDGWVRVGDRDLAERAAKVESANDYYPGRPEAKS